MDNPQAIGGTMISSTEIIAGLYLGEGHFSVWKEPRKNKQWQFSAEIGFSNTDPTLIDAICEWQVSLGIHHHIRTNSQVCYQVVVHHYGDILKALDALEPHLFGKKKSEASLLRRFVEHRLRPKEKSPVKLGNNQHNPYTELDHQIVDEKLRVSSETKSIPVCVAQHSYAIEQMI